MLNLSGYLILHQKPEIENDMEQATIENVNEFLSTLTDDERQLIKDTINFGCWGFITVYKKSIKNYKII